jgi:hypothetical protein
MSGHIEQDLDFSVDLLSAFLWRNQPSVNLQALITEKQTWYNENQEDFWDSWINNVFNLTTANQFGCIVWAIILGLPLSVFNATPQTKKAWGFGSYSSPPGGGSPPSNPLQWRTNFNNGNFSPNASSPISLTLAEQIICLRLRYFQLTTNCGTELTNQILQELFSSYGTIYLIDNLNMTVTLYTSFTISSALGLILSQFDLIPRAQCVKLIASF